jgi:hypothetical protein
MIVKKGEEKREIVFSDEDLNRKYGNLYTLYNAIEFANNKVQLTSTKTVEEKDIFDVINQVLQMQRSLSSEATPNDVLNTIKIFSELLKTMTDPKTIEFLRMLGTKLGGQKT